jgi:hypothetical protein
MSEERLKRLRAAVGSDRVSAAHVAVCAQQPAWTPSVGLDC